VAANPDKSRNSLEQFYSLIEPARAESQCWTG
jgi:hypothetical protein